MPVNIGLFTTLSTTTRAIQIENKKVLFTDTVGFIDHLPLVLIEAFNSTLEETILSDAIILVVDLHESLEEIQRKLDCCLNTIQEIGAGGIPIVTAFNKIDLLSNDEFEEIFSIMSKIAPNPVAISSLKERIFLPKSSHLTILFSGQNNISVQDGSPCKTSSKNLFRL